MPELPEVEVVRRGIADHIVGRTIDHAVLSGSRVARRHPAGPNDLADQLAGQTVLAADRRGKYLWLVLGAQVTGTATQALIVHLGMSGQLLVDGDSAAPSPRHQHALLTFTDGAGVLRFVDQRTFGGLALADLVPDDAADHPYGIPETVAHIAADPFEAGFDTRAVAARIRTKSSAIKRVLLDQGVVSGIGNIYADEALWRAKVNGMRSADSLTKPAIGRILGHARDVMADALGQGGTSFDALYVNVNGASGYFDRSLDAYGQTGKPCHRCGAAIVREEFMNRSSHYCPRCQPRPRGQRKR